ncbi:MAG: MarR family winged helix-turn-helix transcriptional regulator [Desulfocapsaceae bacterium]|nr:MarR family winged helix-turn-helix transcriptional regulator [Desulfocapsaceae bacterium]
MDNKYTKLQECACAALRQSSRTITKHYEAKLKTVGLTSAQFNIMAVLINLGPMPVSRLAAAIGQDRTGLTRNLAIMEKNGFVQFQPGADQRVKEVSLTQHGTNKLDAAIPLWEDAQNSIARHIGDLEIIHDVARKLKTTIGD